MTCAYVCVSTFWKKEEEIGGLFDSLASIVPLSKISSHVSYLIAFSCTLRAHFALDLVYIPFPFIVHFVAHVHTVCVCACHSTVLNINADERRKDEAKSWCRETRRPNSSMQREQRNREASLGHRYCQRKQNGACATYLERRKRIDRGERKSSEQPCSYQARAKAS